MFLAYRKLRREPVPAGGKRAREIEMHGANLHVTYPDIKRPDGSYRVNWKYLVDPHTHCICNGLLDVLGKWSGVSGALCI